MKTKLLLLVLVVVVMTTTGFDCLYDPITVSVDADPISGCATINTGNGSFNSSTGQISVKGLIPSDFRENFQALRIYDVRVSVTHPHPEGIVSGDVYVRFDSQPETRLLRFSGQYETFSAGVSLRNSGGLITYNPVALSSLLSGLTSFNSLPNVAVLRAQGAGPAVTANFNVCMDVFLQVDSNVKP